MNVFKKSSRSNQKRTNGRKLGFQQLEAREVMAGNVAVILNNGDLIVTGDEAANSVEVRRSGVDQYTVEATYADRYTTQINGRSAPCVINGVTRDVMVNLKGGDDG